MLLSLPMGSNRETTSYSCLLKASSQRVVRRKLETIAICECRFSTAYPRDVKHSEMSLVYK